MKTLNIPPPELIPQDYFAPLDLSEIFARPAPIEVDLGCGDGSFLVALAERFPERNFLGIERLLGRVRSACGKAARANLTNVRVLRVESSYAVQHLFPACSIAAMHLMFPDPWPKKRHHRRRIVTREFLTSVQRALVPGGRFRIATDQADYFQAMQALISPAEFREERNHTDEFVPLTTFEKRFVVEGLAIYRLDLRRVC